MCIHRHTDDLYYLDLYYLQSLLLIDIVITIVIIVVVIVIIAIVPSYFPHCQTFLSNKRYE